MAARRAESVLVVVYCVTGQVLLLQRADDPTFWQSVTGSLEEGELPLEAASRELAEETGLVCAGLLDCQSSNRYPIREDWLFRYPPGVTHNIEHVFIAPFLDIQPVKICAAEHLSYTWLDIPQALSKLWSVTNRQALLDFVQPRLAQ